MDIGCLREFLALSKTLNFRACADALFISQSTLSKHINAMEQELGCQLFLRDTKTVRLTEEGRVFSESVRTILGEYDSVVERLSSVHAVRGTLRIGGSIRFSEINRLVEPALASFESKYPDVTILVEDIQWQDYRDKLLKGTFDVVLGIKYPGMKEEGLEFHGFDRVPLCAWVSNSCLLTQKGPKVSLNDFSGMRLRVLDPDKCHDYVSALRDCMARSNVKIKMGRPLSQMFIMDAGEFALTPKFPPSNYFGSGLCALDIADSMLMDVVAVRKKNISNPIAALFFEEIKRSANCGYR